MRKTSGTPSPKTVSTKQKRIAELAKQMPEAAMTSLSHHIDFDWLKEAYARTRKDGAAGVDGRTGRDYAEDLASNLRDLLNRAKSGDHYRAPPVRRVHIPKGDGRKTRPLGIPTFEDKVLQRAVVMVLEPLYEQDFVDWSYGFRPGRNQHQALEAFRKQAMAMRGGWLLEADIESFFDSVDHKLLQAVLRQRVRDGVVLRLIGKWLHAGVMEEGVVYKPEAGTPQGGVISPLLANIFLHEVFDTWFERTVRPHLSGRAFAIRFADDIVMLFERKEDAYRVHQVLPKRFGKYGLRVHPEKTRVVAFESPRGTPPSRPDTFDLLGFTHYWGRPRKGGWVIKRKTARSRFRRALRSITLWLRAHRHDPVGTQHAALVAKLRGHDSYYGITPNYEALKRLRHRVARVWRRWLSTRSRHGHVSWERMKEILRRYPLPRPRIHHLARNRVAKP